MAEGSNAGAKERQRKKTYKWEGHRGGRGGGRGGGGGRGRGRGGGRGGGFSRGGAPSGPWESEGGSKPSHLGRYRDDPLPDIINATGILVTAVQNKERSAEREFVEALEQVADELYPETSDSADNDEEEQTGDMEAMLQRELTGMSGSERSKRFRLCRHDAPCLFYVQTLAPLDPLRMVEHLVRRIETTARCPMKFVRRVVPLSATGLATLHNLKTISEPVIQAGFATEENRPFKFAVVVNSRNSHKLERLEMIRTVAENVETLQAGHSVDLSKPDRTIIIEVNKNSLGVSVVQDYDRLKKVRAPKHKRAKKEETDKQYNVVEIAKAAAIASGATAETSTVEPSAAVQNRAGKVEGTEKRKADTLEGESGMDVDAGAVEGEAVDDEESDAARVAKQQKV